VFQRKVHVGKILYVLLKTSNIFTLILFSQKMYEVRTSSWCEACIHLVYVRSFLCLDYPEGSIKINLSIFEFVNGRQNFSYCADVFWDRQAECSCIMAAMSKQLQVYTIN